MTDSTMVDGFLVTDEKDASRYTLTRDGVLVSVLDYRDDGHTIALTRAFTIPTFRGHGYAGKVVEGAVADISGRGDRKGRSGLLVRGGVVRAEPRSGRAPAPPLTRRL